MTTTPANCLQLHYSTDKASRDSRQELCGCYDFQGHVIRLNLVLKRPFCFSWTPSPTSSTVETFCLNRQKIYKLPLQVYFFLLFFSFTWVYTASQTPDENGNSRTSLPVIVRGSFFCQNCQRCERLRKSSLPSAVSVWLVKPLIEVWNFPMKSVYTVFESLLWSAVLWWKASFPSRPSSSFGCLLLEQLVRQCNVVVFSLWWKVAGRRFYHSRQ